MDNFLPLLVSFLTGLLAGWFFTRMRLKEAARAKQNLQTKLGQAESEIKRLQARLAESELRVQLVYRQADQLEAIRGIGPIYARRLNDAGIYTFAELATQPPQQIRAIVAPQSRPAVDPEGWIAQARLLVNHRTPAINQ